MGLFSAALIIMCFWFNLGWLWGLSLFVVVLIDSVINDLIKDCQKEDKQ